MPGLYVHIPFCKQACHYCDFHFSTRQRTRDQVMEAIRKELWDRADEFKDQTLDTIYLGGGTPTILHPEELRLLFNEIEGSYDIKEGAEITLECNPDDVTDARSSMWRHLGFNRLSIGIQSFSDHHLQAMNRIHDSEDGIRCVQLAKDNGFENISIDLIYGLPDSSIDEWSDALDTAISLGINHVSAYHLTIEPNTVFHKWVKDGKIKPVDDSQSEEQFIMLRERLISAGFDHYEVSNFARSGFVSQHNSSYWRGNHYMGVGPSAHSFNGSHRRWNISNNVLYSKLVASEGNYFDSESLSAHTRANELIMTGLRTSWGLNLREIDRLIGLPFTAQVNNTVSSWVDNDLATRENDVVRLTSKGWMLADGLASDLFIIEP
jgi:oxygen-independent coproporphyrinogen III oxidase